MQPAAHHHKQYLDDQDRAAGQDDTQDNSICSDCGVCHFACSGYLATLTAPGVATTLSSQNYPGTATRFKSFTSVPLDPPPLSRV